MRVAMDATPLLGPRTGIGRYVDRLADALVRLADGPELTLVPFTIRGAGGLTGPPGARVRHRPATARGLQWLWARSEFPPVELLAGRCDVFHATNFVLPPSHQAAGVVTVHDLTFVLHPDTTTSAVLRYQRLVPRSLTRASVVLTDSASVAAEVVERYRIDPDQVVVAPLGVDESWFAARPLPRARRRELGLPDRYLVFVGTREPRKNLGWLVAAHRLARRTDPGTPPLVLVGPAGWGETVAAATADGSLLVPGWLADDDLRAVVAGASALVLPSRYEGFGLPLLEALACGTSVIASDIPVHREVGGDAAAFVELGDTDGLAAALAGAVDPGAPTARTARRARAAGFTWRRCAELTMAAYRRAHEDRRRAAGRSRRSAVG